MIPANFTNAFSTPSFDILDMTPEVLDALIQKLGRPSEKKVKPPAKAEMIGSRSNTLHKDVIIRPTEYIYIFDMPGFDKNDISVIVEQNNLVVEGVRKREEEYDKAEVKTFMRSMGVFKEAFSLNEDAIIYDKDGQVNTSATYENGVLTIQIPRQNPQVTKMRRRIEIR